MPLPALNKPLSWKSTDPHVASLLDDVQANILKGHGRRTTVQLFLRFHTKKNPAAILRAIHQLSGQLTSAKQQLLRAEEFKRSKRDGGTVRCFFLSFAGYKELGIAAKAPAGRAFREGMKAANLGDDQKTWDPHFQKTIHAMVLLADNDRDRLAADRESLIESLGAVGIEVIGEERGEQQFNDSGEGVEHFGYVDGRSQPLLLAEDVEAEKQLNGGSSMWDPAFPANQVLVTVGGRVVGSFFVFRKIEQNVHDFVQAEEALAANLGLVGQDEELAGALMVGRFEDATPVVLRKQAGFGGAPMNNFNYADDPDGTKCPLHAHIRKTNPRGSSGGGIWSERRRIMARRGITYGAREVGMVDRPKGGVGLLFMSYQSRIEAQFEFTQVSWANNPKFPPHGNAPIPGADPIMADDSIKRGNNEQHCPLKWGEPGGKTKPQTFGGFVHVRGGEYFFAPVISDLMKL
jgi:Dyp-type peroxidase family